VDKRFEEIFNSIPPDEPRSRLEPYRELILRWRRQGRTYRRIRELLVEQFSLEVTTPTLFRFVKRRARPRDEEPAAPPPPAPVTPAPADLSRPRRSPEERERLRALASVENHVPVYPIVVDPRPRFEYDPNRPLSNKPPAKKEEE